MFASWTWSTTLIEPGILANRSWFASHQKPYCNGLMDVMYLPHWHTHLVKDLTFHDKCLITPKQRCRQLQLHTSFCEPRGPQVNYILDEIVMAGMVLETNADLILEAVKDAATGKTLKNPSWICRYTYTYYIYTGVDICMYMYMYVYLHIYILDRYIFVWIGIQAGGSARHQVIADRLLPENFTPRRRRNWSRKDPPSASEGPFMWQLDATWKRNLCDSWL